MIFRMQKTLRNATFILALGLVLPLLQGCGSDEPVTPPTQPETPETQPAPPAPQAAVETSTRTLVPAEPNPDAANAAQARDAVNAIMANIQGLDSLSFDLDLHLLSDLADRQLVNEMKVSIALRGNTEAHVEAEERGNRVDLYSDGRTQIAHFVNKKQYMELPAPRSRAEIIGALSARLMREGSLWLGRFLDGQENVVSTAVRLEDKGEAEIDGETFRRIHLGYPLYDLDMYILPDAPQIRRFVIELDRGMPELPAPRDVLGGTVTFDFTNWTVNAPLPDGTFVFVIPEGVTKYEAQERPPPPGADMLGKPAPDFELPLLGGGTFKLSDHKDKVVLIDFFATWCGPCRMGMPVVEDVAKAYEGKDVVFMTVNLKESDAKAEKFLVEVGVDLPVAMDRKGEVQRLYQANTIPRTVILGKDGTLQGIHAGYHPYLKRELKKDIELLLEGKALVEEE